MPGQQRLHAAVAAEVDVLAHQGLQRERENDTGEHHKGRQPAAESVGGELGLG